MTDVVRLIDVDDGDAGAAAVVVFGAPGIARDVVGHLIASSGRWVIDLQEAEAADAVIVAVLVEPSDADWELAGRIGARIVAVVDRREGEDWIVEALLQGADAVVTLWVDPAEIDEAIDAVAAGHARLTRVQAQRVLASLRAARSAASTPLLTARETDILRSIERGHSIKQTARSLGISEKTVQNVQSRLFRKLDARNRAQAVARAHELGIAAALAEPA